MSGITTFCFVASYCVALALEISRLWFRSGIRGALMMGFAGAGLIAHTLFLWQRASEARGAPLSSAFDWFLLAAWVLVGLYLYLTYDHPKTAIGLFVLPLALALIGAAQFAAREPFPDAPASQVWGAIHGIFLLLGTVAVIFGFVSGLMYLLQAYRLKHKLPPIQGLRLPSLEWLARANSRSIVISALMVGIGFLSGVILNVVNHQRQLDELPWSDPTIVRSIGMFAWLLAAALFSVFYKPVRQGRKVAYLTVASFVFLAISIGIRLLVSTEHSARARTISDCGLRIADSGQAPASSWPPTAAPSDNFTPSCCAFQSEIRNPKSEIPVGVRS